MPDGNGRLDLPIVDAWRLDADRRRAFRPGERVRCEDGIERSLPTHFYEVESWKVARETRLSEHFTLHELMTVDVREHPAVRAWPRYVPCAVTLLAAHLELLRQACGTLVWVAANGGYRSPSHRLTDAGSPHCFGTAADVYRVGDDWLEEQTRIERLRATALRVCPAARVRPFGHGPGETDDHLHIDVGHVHLSFEGCREQAG